MYEAVTIHDKRRHGQDTVLAYDLADLLALAGPDALDSDWTCEMVECLGPSADQLHAAATVGSVPGAALAEMAAGVTQTIDGCFEARSPGHDQPWLILKAIDGCYFVVITSRPRLLEQLRDSFKDVRTSPEDANWYNR